MTETGLYYHGARYYAPWLGRWTSCDPGGLIDGLNLYIYARDNPITYLDVTGRWSKWWTIAAVVAVGAVVTVATAGAGAGVAAAVGAGVLEAGAETAVVATAAVATETAVATTAVAATETALATTSVAAETALATTSVAAETALTSTSVAAETALTSTSVAGTSASGLTASQVTGLATAAGTIATAAQTPVGQEVLESVEENLPALENEAQALTGQVTSSAAENAVTNVFRVEGPGNARLDISLAGDVAIKGRSALFLNFGDAARAQEFLDTRLRQGFEGTVIKSFQVLSSYVDALRGSAVPESFARQFPNSPFAVDVNQAADQFGLRAANFLDLLRNIIPGSGSSP